MVRKNSESIDDDKSVDAIEDCLLVNAAILELKSWTNSRNGLATTG
jgi:hypothetical protein